MILKTTKSVCPHCLRVLDAVLEEREDGIYMSLSKHAIDAAMQLRSVLLSEPCKSRYSMPIDGLTNQLFVEMSNYDYERLSKNFSFEIWQRNQTTCMVRICTSWATTQQAVEQLAKALSL